MKKANMNMLKIQHPDQDHISKYPKFQKLKQAKQLQVLEIAKDSSLAQ
jgi:hypothetical protein